jgi:hypothetical protein
MMDILRNAWQEEDGQDIAEYAVLFGSLVPTPTLCFRMPPVQSNSMWL